MEMHEFDIVLNPNGTVSIHVEGTKGPACEKYVEMFQEILQSELEVERTSEYYAPPTDVNINIEQRT